METIWQGLLIFGLALMAGHGINLWLIWDKLRDEQVAVRDRCYPWSYGYAHYLAAKRRYSLWAIYPVLGTCVVLFVLFYAQVPISPGQALPLLGLLICAISAGYLLITFAASLIESGIIDAYALIAFQLTSLKCATMLELTLKRLAVIYGLRLLLMEALGLLLLSNSLVLLWLFPVLFAAYSLSDLPLNDYYWNCTDVATSLEQSQWSAVASRIQAWATRLNVPVPEIYVSESATTFIYEVRYSQRRRPSRVYFNTLFLSKTDWRQQDALFVMALAVLQADTLRRSTLRHIWRTAYNTLLAVGLIAGAALIMRFSPTRMAELLGLVDGICLVVMLARSLFQLIFTLRRKPSPYGKFHRIAAETTGDPLATVVAHHTASMLRHPHTMEIHLTIVKNFIQRKRPLAPWAATRVASSEPFDQGMYRLTVPLEEAPAAAPVPTGPYEEGAPGVTRISDPVKVAEDEVSSK
jgi:hypothetical protein